MSDNPQDFATTLPLPSWYAKPTSTPPAVVVQPSFGQLGAVLMAELVNYLRAQTALARAERARIEHGLRPSTIHRPTVSSWTKAEDGKQTWAVECEAHSVGIGASGESPEDAMRAFDELWEGAN